MDQEEDDPLTNLPQDIKVAILSLLQTADSVRTSVLSKNWEDIWKYVNDLHFDDKYRNNPMGRRVHFIDFVYQVLMNSECKHLNSFHLSCSKTLHPKHVETWIKTAMKRQVKKLIINYENDNLVLSGRFLSWESFRRLEMRGAMTLKLSPRIHFPNLTELYLFRTRFRYEGAQPMEELVLNVPALRVLQVYRCMWHHVRGIKICATGIMEFMMAWSNYSCECCGIRNDFRIEMDGCPNFETKGPMLEDVSIARPELVVEAEFCQHFEITNPENFAWIIQSCKRIATLLRTFSNVTVLKLSTDVIEATTRDDAPLKYPLMEKVQNLLVFSGFQMITWCGAFMKLLNSFPKLEVIEFVMHGDYWHTHLDLHDTLFATPNCISQSLQLIRFEHFSASLSELQLLRVFLEHGALLKQVCLVTPLSNKNLLEYMLLSVPRASEEVSVNLEFIKSKRRRNA